MRRDYLEVAADFLKEHHPDAKCAFVAGSMLRGEATATSDIDLVVLYDDTYQTPHRNNAFYQDWLIEVFVHNIKAQDYFFNSDKKSGMPLMPDMVLNGHVIGPEPEFAERQREKARAIFAEGPDPLDEKESIGMRYFITDALDDLMGTVKSDEAQATLAKLYGILANFHLRSNNRWSGSGKWVIRALKRADPAFAQRYADAFDKAFAGNSSNVIELTRQVLAPFGGECRAWQSFASDNWKL